MGDARTTVAAICFADDPALNFDALAAELARALGSERTQRQTTPQGDRIAIFDVDGTRLVLGHARNGGAVHGSEPGAMLVVGVGSAPGQQAQSAIFRHRQDICTGLIQRVERMHPVGQLIWREEDEVFTPALFARLRDTILIQPLQDARAAEEASQQDTAPRVLHRRPDPLPVPTHAPLHADQRQPGAPDPDAAQRVTLPPTVPPRAGPDIALFRQSPEAIEMVRIRAALYGEGKDEDPALRMPLPLPQRLTIYTINATLMVVALPVGAAMMTYCVLGRESLSTVARAMAITGIGLGLLHSDFGKSLIALIS